MVLWPILGLFGLTTKKQYNKAPWPYPWHRATFVSFPAIINLSDAQLHKFYRNRSTQSCCVDCPCSQWPWTSRCWDSSVYPYSKSARTSRIWAGSHRQLSHRGLGTALLAVLDRIASIKGIEILRGFVLADNSVMIGWLGRLGAVKSMWNWPLSNWLNR